MFRPHVERPAPDTRSKKSAKVKDVASERLGPGGLLQVRGSPGLGPREHPHGSGQVS